MQWQFSLRPVWRKSENSDNFLSHSLCTLTPRILNGTPWIYSFFVEGAYEKRGYFFHPCWYHFLFIHWALFIDRNISIFSSGLTFVRLGRYVIFKKEISVIRMLDSQYMSKKFILMRLSEALWKVVHKNPYTYTEKFLYILRMNVNLQKRLWQFHVNSRTSSKWNNPRELLVFWIKYLLMLPLVHL